MRDVAFCTDSFAGPGLEPYGERTLSCLLWALIYADTGYLLTHPNTPALYSSGIEWRAEKPQGRTACPEGEGQELFLGVRQVLAQGHADCEDVASWRVSELRIGRGNPSAGPRMAPSPGYPRPTVVPPPWPSTPTGVDVWPAFFKREILPGHWLYHIVVFWPQLGQFEDPSRVLGMGGARRYG